MYAQTEGRNTAGRTGKWKAEQRMQERPDDGRYADATSGNETTNLGQESAERACDFNH